VNNRSVLLDGSFLDALLAPGDPMHDGATALYRELVDSYVAGRDLLYALSTVLNRLPKSARDGALAPVVTIHVAHQHRVAARSVIGLDYPEDALTVVMMQRERIRTIATVSDRWDEWDIEVLKAADADSVNSRTESVPAQPPPGE
jgi:predicted nucleic acid-binding protein